MQCRNELPSREARAICVEENDPMVNQLSIIPFFNFQFRRLSSPNSIPDTNPDPGGSILLTLAGFCNRQFQFTSSLVRGRRWIRVHGPPTNDDLPSRQSHRPLSSFPSFPPDPTSSQPASRTHISLPCHAGWEGGRPARVAATDEVAKQRCAAAQRDRRPQKLFGHFIRIALNVLQSQGSASLRYPSQLILENTPLSCASSY